MTVRCSPDKRNVMRKTFSIILTAVIFHMATLPSVSDTYRAKDGAIIDYEVVGQGAPFVMLHSGMMSREDMRVQIEYFSKYYQVIAIDAREQGRSTSSATQITYELMADDVIGVLDQLKIKKANIFGQSDGGMTGLVTTHLYQDRVKKLIIHGAVYNYNAYPEEQRVGWKNTTWHEDDEGAKEPSGFPGMAIEHYLLGHDDLTNFEAHLQEMSRMWASGPTLTKSDLERINVSTLVIVGDHYDVSIRHNLEMHETLPNSQFFVAPAATHFIHQEKPDLLHKVIHDFLKE